MVEQDDLSKARYAASPGNLGVAGWWEAVKRAVANIPSHRLSLTAAGVAFFGFLSLYPAIAAMVFIYGLLADVAELRSHLQLISQLVPEQTRDILFERLEAVVSADENSGFSTAILISLFITFWSGSRGVAVLLDIIGVAYRQDDNRSFLRTAALSLVLTIGMLVTLVTTLFLVAGIPLLLEHIYISVLTAELTKWLRWPLVLGLFCVALCLLYRLSPDRRDARFAWLLPGAGLATILWGCMSVLFSIYVENFGNYDATFGSLSAIIVLLLWFYYSIFIITLGAEFNAELELMTKVDTTIGPSRPLGSRGAYVADHVREPISKA